MFDDEFATGIPSQRIIPRQCAAVTERSLKPTIAPFQGIVDIAATDQPAPFRRGCERS
jgi:hypothetical protein